MQVNNFRNAVSKYIISNTIRTHRVLFVRSLHKPIETCIPRVIIREKYVFIIRNIRARVCVHCYRLLIWLQEMTTYWLIGNCTIFIQQIIIYCRFTDTYTYIYSFITIPHLFERIREIISSFVNSYKCQYRPCTLSLISYFREFRSRSAYFDLIVLFLLR